MTELGGFQSDRRAKTEIQEGVRAERPSYEVSFSVREHRCSRAFADVIACSDFEFRRFCVKVTNDSQCGLFYK